LSNVKATTCLYLDAKVVLKATVELILLMLGKDIARQLAVNPPLIKVLKQALDRVGAPDQGTLSLCEDYIFKKPVILINTADLCIQFPLGRMTNWDYGFDGSRYGCCFRITHCIRPKSMNIYYCCLYAKIAFKLGSVLLIWTTQIIV